MNGRAVDTCVQVICSPRVGLILLALAGSVAAENRVAPAFQAPAAHALVEPVFEVKAPVPALAGEAWHLLALGADGNPADTLVMGTGPWSGAQSWQAGPLANGIWTLRLEVITAGGTLAGNREIVVGRPQKSGFPRGQALQDAGFRGQPMAEPRGGSLAWVEGITVDGQRGLPRNLHLTDQAGTALPGFPRDLSRDGLATSGCSSPLWITDSAGQAVVVLTQDRLVRFDLGGGPDLPFTFPGEAASELLHFRTPEGLQRLLFASSGPDGCRVHLLDSGLVPLWTSLHPAQTPGARLPLALADLDGDRQPEIYLGTYNGPAASGQLWRLDPADGGSTLFATVPSLVPAQLLSGEITGDWQTDLVLLGSQQTVCAFNSLGLQWTATSAGRNLGLATLADLSGDRRQELCFTDHADQTPTRLRVLDGNGQPLAPLDGLDLGLDQRPGFEPLVADMDGNGQPEILIASGLKDPGAFHGQVRVFSGSGTVLDQWVIGGRPTSPLRLTDLDGDGWLDLLLTDTFNRLNAWHTTSRDPDPGQPLGEPGRGGRSLQVLAGSPPCTAWLDGRLLVQDTLVVAPGDVLCGNRLSLLQGSLVIQGMLDLAEALATGPGTRLEFHPGAQVLHEGLRADVSGTLRLQGPPESGPGVAPLMPVNLATLLNRLDLRLRDQSRLELVDCTLQNLAAPLVLHQGQSLALSGAWLMHGQGIRLDGAALEMDHSLIHAPTAPLELLNGASATISHSTFSSADGTALRVADADLVLHHSLLLNNGLALELEGQAVLLADSCHFQANGLALRVLDQQQPALLQHCDFVDCGGPAIHNLDDQGVLAPDCHWSGSMPNLGPVSSQPASELPYFEPETTAPVFEVRPGPMINGDEPLLAWDPVEYTLNSIPVVVSYRVYRSSEPYGIVGPANLVSTVDTPYYHDGAASGDRVFYAVTVWLGKSAQ